MFHGPPLPLSSSIVLSELLAHGNPAEQLGAWIRGNVRPTCSVLASADLGILLGRCARIAIREGERTVVLASETLIRWRALQVATATPYLPGLGRLEAMFPGLRITAGGCLVPMREESPEKVLAMLVAEGVRVAGSQIVYAPHHLPPP